MAIETTYGVNAKVEESDAILARFNSTPVTRVSTYTEYAQQRISVADGASDLSVDFGGCSSGDLLFLETDQTITVKISGGTQEISVASVMVLSGAISALTISNASGSTATVDILILD